MFEARDRYGQAMANFMRNRGGDLAGMQSELLSTVWEDAYTEAGRPVGPIGPEAGQRLMDSFQDGLRTAMRDACGEVPAAELFFAVRLMTPHLLATIGWGSDENRPYLNPKFAMGLRRIATYGALVYGVPTPAGYSASYGGAFETRDDHRVSGAFAKLLLLSDAFAWAYLYQAMFGRGNEMTVDAEGPDLSRGDYAHDALLTTSLDERKRLYYNPFSRIGEFSGEAAAVLDPFEEGRQHLREGQALFLSSSYEVVGDQGWAAYRLRGWPLEPLEAFLQDLSPELVAEAWSVPSGMFMDLLGGLCLLVEEKLENSEELRAAHESSVVSLAAEEIEGRPLIERAVEYSREHHRSSECGELEAHREKFLSYLLSNGKATAHDPFLHTSVGDTRYSYPVHCFGHVYAFDLYHSDHWLHRLMDLLAREMRGGSEADAAGSRVEERMWNFFEGSEGIDAIKGLRGLVVESRKGHVADDLDCPLRVGGTLVLAEVKGERLHYETEAVERRFVRERWEGDGERRKGSREYLEKIDDTARRVAAMREDDKFCASLVGVNRILPILCRPYPEWIPNLDEHFWLRLPSENDPGVPRVLTPEELRNFLSETSEEGLRTLPGQYLVEVDDSR